jgi:hypothetical protein
MPETLPKKPDDITTVGAGGPRVVIRPGVMVVFCDEDGKGGGLKDMAGGGLNDIEGGSSEEMDRDDD